MRYKCNVTLCREKNIGCSTTLIIQFASSTGLLVEMFLQRMSKGTHFRHTHASRIDEHNFLLEYSDYTICIHVQDQLPTCCEATANPDPLIPAVVVEVPDVVVPEVHLSLSRIFIGCPKLVSSNNLHRLQDSLSKDPLIPDVVVPEVHLSQTT
jgi:hypothetical protein